jgi:urate oxidase/2-oxo-4-hydroxy-4-carboxy-5-ureidoimidazoline decarboxylase
VEQFASGWKRSYYGKGDVIAYRLHRDGNAPGEQSPVFGASVLMLVYGDAFWRTYTEGDNTGLVATDSMKNFIQRETMNYEGDDLTDYCYFLAETFIGKYQQVEGVQVSAAEIPYEGVNGQAAFAPGGPERATARIELSRTGPRPEDADLQVVEATSGIRGFKLLRLGGSAFHGFVRDDYTTLPDIRNRPLHMWLDLEWRYSAAPAGPLRGTRPTPVGRDPRSGPGDSLRGTGPTPVGRDPRSGPGDSLRGTGPTPVGWDPRSGPGDSPAGDVARVRAIVRDVFASFESGSIQQVIYQMGTRILAELPAIHEVHLEANNRTWDTIAERGDELGVYTDARPPYGCLGLRLTR